MLQGFLSAPARMAADAYRSVMTRAHGGVRPGEPPLVPGNVPLLGAGFAFGRDAMTFLEGCRQEHGDVFTVFVAGRRMTFMLDPMSVTAVLKNKALEFAPIADEVMDKAFGIPIDREQLPMVHDAEELARTALRGNHLSPLTEGMEAALAPRLRAVVDAASSEVELYQFVRDCMFPAGTDALFGEGVMSDDMEREFEAFDRVFPLMLAGLPRPFVRAGVRALERLKHRTGNSGPGASRWIQRREVMFASMAAPDFGRLQAAILWAIHANTIPATFWALAYLLHDRSAREVIEQELRDVAGPAGARPPALPTCTLDRLPYLDSAVKEALRLSTGSLTARSVTEPTQLQVQSNTFELRKGDRVLLSPHFTHFDEGIFEAPHEYRFDRFYAAKGTRTFNKDGQRVPLPLMPFGAGQSMCPGRFFAMNEVKLFVAMVLSTTTIESLDAALPAFDLTRVGLGIYPPATALRVRVASR